MAHSQLIQVIQVIRSVLPAEYERVGDLTVAAYAALPVDHLWEGYDDEIRAVAKRLERAEVFVAVVDGTVVGAVTSTSATVSPGTSTSCSRTSSLCMAPEARSPSAAEVWSEDCSSVSSSDSASTRSRASVSSSVSAFADRMNQLRASCERPDFSNRSA